MKHAKKTYDREPAHHKPKTKDTRPLKMSLKLTAMIDVIFLLLIYFVVSASFTMGEGVLVANMPSCGGCTGVDDPPKPKITVALTTLGHRGVGYRVRLHGFPEAPRNFKELATVLSKVQRDSKKGRHGLYPPDSPVIIQPTSAVRWQHVVNAFNATVKARYHNVSFAQVSD